MLLLICEILETYNYKIYINTKKRPLHAYAWLKVYVIKIFL